MYRKSTKLEVIWSTVAALAILLALVSSTGAVQAQGLAADGGPAPLLTTEGAEIVPDQYIVVYKADTMRTEGDIRASIAALGGEVKFVYGAALNGFAAYLPAAALDAVRADPAVAYVEADAVVRLSPLEEVSADTTQTGATWGLDRIDQRNLPLDTNYNYNYNGSGVHAYIIDTGILPTHTQFGARASADYDAVGGSGIDCNGHGTHVAGTVGGSTYGVAKGVRLHGVRVLDCSGSGTNTGVIAGINWVASHRVLPAVANMSLGGSKSTAVNDAATALIGKGVVLAVAAGNDYGANACNYSPASTPAAITVGSTTSTDAVSSFSNLGSCLDIFAPGSNITSAWYTSNTATNTISGTSMATPHVAGAAALFLQGHTSATPATVRHAMVYTSSLGKITGTLSGSYNRLLYSLYGVVYTPVQIAPGGTIKDKTPTYQWSKVTNATNYKLETYKGTTLIYSKIVTATAACAATPCSLTPATTLSDGIYKWKIQAYANGAWRTWSEWKYFTVQTVVTGPKPGTWNGIYSIIFKVASNQVQNFSILVGIDGCGTFRITHTTPAAIASNKFSFGGPFAANGTFNTPTTAYGNFLFTNFSICGGYLNGGTTWSASWVSANVPLSFTSDKVDVASEVVGPVEGLDAFMVEKVDP